MIDLNKIDMRQLLGGKSFTTPCTLFHNGIAILTHALTDSGAGGFAFIDTQLAKDLCRAWKLSLTPLPDSVGVKGYDGALSNIASHALFLNVLIDNRIQKQVPFVVLTLGTHEVILGKTWMSHFDVWLNVRDHKLVWPHDKDEVRWPPNFLTVDRSSLRQNPINRTYQQEVLERKAAFDEEDSISPILTPEPGPRGKLDEETLSTPEPVSRVTSPILPVPTREVDSDFEISDSDGSASTSTSTESHRKKMSPSSLNYYQKRRQKIRQETTAWKASEKAHEESWRNFREPAPLTHQAAMRESIGKMDRELHTPDKTLPDTYVIPQRRPSPKKQRRLERPPKIDIAELNVIGFHHHMRQPGTELFTVTVAEINKAIDWKQQATRNEGTTDEETYEAALDRLLPPEYRNRKAAFSKQTADTLPAHTGVDHKIELEKDLGYGYGPLYKQSVEELKVMKKYLEENLDKGFIVPSHAPFACPTLFVKKANGGLRFCIDFRKLNDITRKDQYPLPLIDELYARLATAQIYTKIDIQQAFHRIRMSPDSEEYTTFRTRYGSYKCKVMPFGLTNGPATFQRHMNNILFDYLDVFCTAYLDDIIIYSEDPLEHAAHVHKVLERLEQHGLQADIRKCEFNVKRIKFLGFVVTTDGLEVDPEATECVRNWEPPKTVRGIQSFLGFCNFYRRFIRDYGKIAKPLQQLTKMSEKFDMKVEGRLEAFHKLKELVLAPECLRHYRPELPSRVETDASDGVLAGVFSQKYEDGWHPVSFFSKTMAPAELNYDIHDKEMLAIIRSLSHWRAELINQQGLQKFEIFSDHKALEYFMTTKQLTGRQARWAELLSEFFFMIMYRPGKQNAAADALSRKEQDTEGQLQTKAELRTRPLIQPSQIDPRILQDLADLPDVSTLAPVEFHFDQQMGLITEVLEANKNAEVLQPFRDLSSTPDSWYSLREDGLLLYKGRLIVPDLQELRTRLIAEAHSTLLTAHPGRAKTFALLRHRYFWPRMLQDITTFVGNCHKCSRANHRQDKTPGFLHPLPVPERPQKHLVMDFKSMPKDKLGFDAVLVIMDRLAKDSVTIPCHSTCTARELAVLFISNYWRFNGSPDTIVTDRGPQFISSFWEEFARILGIRHKYSSGQHAQTAGQVEIMNKYLDQRLRPFIDYYQDNWSELIPMMDHAQLTLPHDSIGMSPYELKFGHQPKTTFDWERPAPPADKPLTPQEITNHADAQTYASRAHSAWKLARSLMEKAQGQMAQAANKKRRKVDWDVGDFVWVTTRDWKTKRPKKKLDDQWDGPFEVLAKEGHSWRIALPESIKVHPVFSSDKLRKARTDALPGQQQEDHDAVQVDKEIEYEVQDILKVRLERNGTLRYQVSWKNLDPDPSYYPAADFMYSPHKLRDFHLANPLHHGPPKLLLEWIRAWESDDDDAFNGLEDDTMMGKAARDRFFKN